MPDIRFETLEKGRKRKEKHKAADIFCGFFLVEVNDVIMW